MSLKKFRTSSKLVTEGAWFNITENSDKTKCRVKLRRSGRANRKWLVSMREHTADIDTDSLSPEEDAKLMATVFAESCVVDWEHLQPEDDGNNLAFSDDNAVNLLTDPEWIDLLSDWQTKAGAAANYKAAREAEAGN